MRTKTITLPLDQMNSLYCFLLLTTGYRKSERESWESLAKEMNEDGTPKFPNAAGNARFWAEMQEIADNVCRVIDNATLVRD